MTARLEMLIEDIVVEDRARADVGDLTSLKRSIGELGLLQPVGVSVDGKLVFGERRLEACRQLGFASIPVRFLSGARDELHALRAELDENIERRQFSAIEAAALRRRIKDLAAKTKKDDPAAAGDAVAVPTVEPDGEARDVVEAPTASRQMTAAEVDAQVANVTGYSITTLKRVDRIAEFVNCGDPATEEAARDALRRIEAGAPVMPLLGRVLELHAAAEAAARGDVPPRPAVEAPASSDVPRSALADGSPADSEAGREAERPAAPAEVLAVPAVEVEPAPAAPRFPPLPSIPPLPGPPPAAHPGWDEIVEAPRADPAITPEPAAEPAPTPRNDDAPGRTAVVPPASDVAPPAESVRPAVTPQQALVVASAACETLMTAETVVRSTLHAINNGSLSTLTAAADALESAAARLRAVAVSLQEETH